MKYPDIAKEINEMAEEDKKIREEFYTQNQNDQSRLVYAEKMHKIDERNHKRMMEIVEEIGYPTISKVGKEASYNAWLIVQHYSRDGLQKKCLELMEKEKNDVDPKNIAYLKDRILVYSGKKQIYGTQVRPNEKTGLREPFEIEDPENVNKLRDSIGLEPIEDYIKSFNN